MKYIIEEELYFKIGSILDNYGDLLERLGQAYRSPNLDDDWRDLDKIWDEYNSLPTYEEERVADEKKDREFEVLDRVRVIDSGECYTTYDSWVDKYVKEPSEKYAWVYGRSCNDDSYGTILVLAPHERDGDIVAYVRMDNGDCYLINTHGLIHA